MRSGLSTVWQYIGVRSVRIRSNSPANEGFLSGIVHLAGMVNETRFLDADMSRSA